MASISSMDDSYQELSGEEATSVPHPAASVPDLLDEHQHDMAQLATWRLKETHYRPRPFCQPEINTQMRRVLVDWMSDVADDFKFLSETLFLAINYLDRFLGSQAVPRNILQLLGVTCLWLAAKYEEVNPPTSYELANATDGMCDPKQMAGMEKALLSVLEYNLGCPTSLSFLHHYIHVQLMPQVSAMHPNAALHDQGTTTPSGKHTHSTSSSFAHTPSAPSSVPSTSAPVDSTPCTGNPQPRTSAAAAARPAHAGCSTPAGAEHFCRMAEVLLCVELLDPSYSQNLPSVSAAAALYASSLLFRQPALVPAIFALSKASPEVITELGTKMLSAMYRVQQAGQRIACLRQYLEWQSSVASLSTPPHTRPVPVAAATPCSVPRLPPPPPPPPPSPHSIPPPRHSLPYTLQPLRPTTPSRPTQHGRRRDSPGAAAFPSHRSHGPTSLLRGPPTPRVAVCKPSVHASVPSVRASKPDVHASTTLVQASKPDAQLASAVVQRLSRPPIPPIPTFAMLHGQAPHPPSSAEAPSRKRILTRSAAAAAVVAALSHATAESLNLD
ncbi:MAG: hypothetical protein WDW36_007162 [Sanguina aurantia]